METKKQLKEAMKAAMKAREQAKLEAIRILLAAFQYEEIQRKVDDLPDEVEVQILQTELKKRKEELDFADKAARSDLKEKLAAEIRLIEGFLPQQLTAPELEKVIAEFRGREPGANMGAIMKFLKDSFAGRYDGKLASEIVKKIMAS